jgi:predicted transcriptional regulator
MDKSLQQNVLLYKGKADEIKSTLKIDKTDSPWFFVLDTTGKVLYSTSGAFTDAKMEEIEKALGQQ